MAEAYGAPEMLPWLPFGPGKYAHDIEWKLLNADLEGDRWTVLFRGPDGAYIFPHIHDDEAEGWLFHGGIQISEDKVGRGPSWFREEKAASHPRTVFVGDTEFVITMIGAITWVQEDGSHIKTTAAQGKAIWEEQFGEYLDANPDYKAKYEEFMAQFADMEAAH